MSIQHQDQAQPPPQWPPNVQKSTITGLTGNEYLILSNISGQTIWEGNKVDFLNTGNLNKGVYFLSISGNSTQQVFRLIKQ